MVISIGTNSLSLQYSPQITLYTQLKFIVDLIIFVVLFVCKILNSEVLSAHSQRPFLQKLSPAASVPQAKTSA